MNEILIGILNVELCNRIEAFAKLLKEKAQNGSITVEQIDEAVKEFLEK